MIKEHVSSALREILHYAMYPGRTFNVWLFLVI